MKKDWTGNTKSIFTPHGATSHSEGERAERDYYATNPKAIDALFEVENFSPYIWEPACGECHLSQRMLELGKNVYSSDLIDRRPGDINNKIDFLKCDKFPTFAIGTNWMRVETDIITNPPYSYAREFCEKAISLNPNKVAMFLKLTFLESKGRKEFFEKHPPRYVYIFSERIDCGKNGDFSHPVKAVAYAWFVWYRDYKGNPEIRWI